MGRENGDPHAFVSPSNDPALSGQAHRPEALIAERARTATLILPDCGPAKRSTPTASGPTRGDPGSGTAPRHFLRPSCTTRHSVSPLAFFSHRSILPSLWRTSYPPKRFGSTLRTGAPPFCAS